MHHGKPWPARMGKTWCQQGLQLWLLACELDQKIVYWLGLVLNRREA